MKQWHTHVWIGVYLLLAFSSLTKPAKGATQVDFEWKAQFVREDLSFLFLEMYGDHLYAGTLADGWHVVDALNPVSLEYVSNRTPLDVWQMIARGPVVFVADAQQVSFFELTDPAAPVLAVRTDTRDFSNYQLFSLELVDGWLVGSKVDGTIYQVQTAGPFRLVARGAGRELTASGPYLYAAGPAEKVSILSRQSGAWEVLKEIPVTEVPARIRASGKRLYVAGEHLQVFDITDPVSPMFMGQVELGGLWTMEVDGEIAYVARREEREIVAYDCSDGTAPRRAGSIETTGQPWDLILSSNYMYVADEANGIVTYERTLSAFEPLQITEGPIGQTVNAADGFSLGVVTSGTGSISYQWFLDDLAIEGATSASYNVAAGELTREQSGLYHVEVTDGTHTLSSEPVEVRVVGGLGLELREGTEGIAGYELVLSAAGGLGSVEADIERSGNLVDWTPIAPISLEESGEEAVILNVEDLPGSGPHFLRVVER